LLVKGILLGADAHRIAAEHAGLPERPAEHTAEKGGDDGDQYAGCFVLVCFILHLFLDVQPVASGALMSAGCVRDGIKGDVMGNDDTLKT
jgi:hypothetical protein